jgi:hypothetical protein
MNLGRSLKLVHVVISNAKKNTVKVEKTEKAHTV